MAKTDDVWTSVSVESSRLSAFGLSASMHNGRDPVRMDHMAKAVSRCPRPERLSPGLATAILHSNVVGSQAVAEPRDPHALGSCDPNRSSSTPDVDPSFSRGPIDPLKPRPPRLLEASSDLGTIRTTAQATNFCQTCHVSISCCARPDAHTPRRLSRSDGASTTHSFVVLDDWMSMQSRCRGASTSNSPRKSCDEVFRLVFARGRARGSGRVNGTAEICA